MLSTYIYKLSVYTHTIFTYAHISRYIHYLRTNTNYLQFSLFYLCIQFPNRANLADVLLFSVYISTIDGHFVTDDAQQWRVRVGSVTNVTNVMCCCMHPKQLMVRLQLVTSSNMGRGETCDVQQWRASVQLVPSNNGGCVYILWHPTMEGECTEYYIQQFRVNV